MLRMAHLQPRQLLRKGSPLTVQQSRPFLDLAAQQIHLDDCTGLIHMAFKQGPDLPAAAMHSVRQVPA